MQDELQAERPELEISLLIVNEAGHEAGNEDLFAVSDLPVLQDDATARVWEQWEAVWRDVRILDAENHLAQVYNLTEHNLGEPENYAELKAQLIATAEAGR